MSLTLNNINTVPEYTYQMFLIEDGLAFRGLTEINNKKGNWLEITYHSEEDDGTFSEITDYTQIVDLLVKIGPCGYYDFAGLKNGKIEMSNYDILIPYKYSNEVTIQFKKLINIYVCTINNKPLFVEVDAIKGELAVEFYWHKTKLQNLYANSFCIFFDCKSLINTTLL